jgi:hypothetical protein
MLFYDMIYKLTKDVLKIPWVAIRNYLTILRSYFYYAEIIKVDYFITKIWR